MENIFRTVGYLLLLAINIIAYWFLHSHFHFIIMVLMIVAPVFSVATALFLRNKITAEVKNACFKGEYGVQNQESFFKVRLINPTLWASLDVKLLMEVKNDFFGTKGEVLMSVPVYSKKGYELTLPLIAELPGRLTLTLKEIKIKDLMGFVFLKKSMGDSGELVVMPELFKQEISDKTYFETGMLESEESSKRGNDFSDVNEIREYIPGDKLMSIHWKLSAKRDILMVKDRVSMSDKQLVVIPELCNVNHYDLNTILVTTYSLIHTLVKDKLNVRLMYWSKNRFEYEDIRIDYVEALDDAFGKMFYEDCYQDMGEAASHMPLVHPEMKSYLHISASGGTAMVAVKENG